MHGREVSGSQNTVVGGLISWFTSKDSRMPGGGLTRWSGSVAASWGWTCGTQMDGSSYCWGNNTGSTLGIGMDSTAAATENTPTAISIP